MTCPVSVTYNGSAQTPCSANVTGAGGLSQSLTVTYSANTNAGTATASASLRRRRQPQRQHRFEDVHDRQGVLDDGRHVPGQRDLQRVGADAVLGECDGRRRSEPVGDGHLRGEHERRHGDRERDLRR